MLKEISHPGGSQSLEDVMRERNAYQEALAKIVAQGNEFNAGRNAYAASLEDIAREALCPSLRCEAWYKEQPRATNTV